MNRAPLAGAAALAVALLATGCSSPMKIMSAAAGASGHQPKVAASPGAPAPGTSQPAAVSTAVPPPAPAPAAKVVSTEVGWGVRDGATWGTAVLRNSGNAAGKVQVAFTAFGREGQVLALGRAGAVQLRVGETTAVGAGLEVPEGATIARVSADVSTTPLATPGTAVFTLAGINVQRAGRRLLGTVSSDSDTSVTVTAVCHNPAGLLLGGGSVLVSGVSAGGASTFQIDPMVVSTVPKGCAIYTSLAA